MADVKTHQPQLTRFQRMKIEQPWCVFCGGTTRGTSIDHVPPRGAFNFKQRPKGLEFMCCKDCADGSRRTDLVAALFARFYSVTPGTKKHRQEITEIFRAIGNNAPEVLKEMQVQEVLSGDHPARKAFPAAKATFPFGPIATSYLAAFGARLALALHFEKTHRILPGSGGVCVFSRSNNTLAEEGMPEEFFAMLGPPESLEQGKFSSAEQSLYASRQEDDGAQTAHFITFRLSFALQAFVVRDFSKIEKFVSVRGGLGRPPFAFRPQRLTCLRRAAF